MKPGRGNTVGVCVKAVRAVSSGTTITVGRVSLWGTGDTRGGFANRAVLLYRAMVARWDYMARFRYVPDGRVRSRHRSE